jgi:hypothetical protein
MAELYANLDPISKKDLKIRKSKNKLKEAENKQADIKRNLK